MSDLPGPCDLTPSLDSMRWHQILNGLLCRIVPPSTMPGKRLKPAPVPGAQAAVRIVILDRPSDSTVIVQWSSPIGCRYGEQIWRKAFARKSGLCVLTGTRITRGDAIFKPRRARQNHVNASAMIDAAALEAMPHIAA